MDTNNDILLIDAGHLYNGGKAIKQPFDFEKWSILIDLLQSHFKITYHRRKMFNSVRDPATAESNHFHVAAKRAKIDVILSGLKKVLCFCQKNGCNCPHKKGGEALVREMQAGVDVALAAHGMHEYHLGCRSITFVTGLCNVIIVVIVVCFVSFHSHLPPSPQAMVISKKSST